MQVHAKAKSPKKLRRKLCSFMQTAKKLSLKKYIIEGQIVGTKMTGRIWESAGFLPMNTWTQSILEKVNDDICGRCLDKIKKNNS
eukprot:16634_4